MTSTLAKSALLTTAVGASGAGGYFGSKLITSKPTVQETKKQTYSVADLLAKDKTKQLLDKNSGKSHADWTTAWNNYKNQNNGKTTNGSDPLGITNWSTERTASNGVPDSFLTRCDEESKKQVVDTSDPIYVTVLTWCTKAKVTGQG
ncbi:hypothetical protein HF1_11920 [Mycoplasma haemofelis str. Langford 1]|uniref:Uncharacterized protein n=1 Tax=Mycoplasma haemofelis (strain Langford 1) TaxID=941640 RepID=E8ZJ79_MYCHL|nr:hypothetical protein [Mycoplasma haemofelis]CBY93200.1 hypothetical protein HF1_11920 [Mycoplasma haemofelis str. Langford 1]